MNITLSDIIARFKREPLIVLGLVVPLLALLVQLGVGVPTSAIVAVQTFLGAVAVAVARGKVTPVSTSEEQIYDKGEEMFLNGYDVGHDDATADHTATCP